MGGKNVKSYPFILTLKKFATATGIIMDKKIINLRYFSLWFMLVLFQQNFHFQNEPVGFFPGTDDIIPPDFFFTVNQYRIPRRMHHKYTGRPPGRTGLTHLFGIYLHYLILFLIERIRHPCEFFIVDDFFLEHEKRSGPSLPPCLLKDRARQFVGLIITRPTNDIQAVRRMLIIGR